MTKHRAHFQAFGYEPLRMKPVHFASGFFIALTQQAYRNKLLNKVAVIKSGKGLLGEYAVEKVFEQLQADGLIAESITQEDVGLLRVQVNGIVNNDSAMFPAFDSYRAKGNDYTFISPRVLTTQSRTDGYAGLFVHTVLDHTKPGKAVLEYGRELVNETPGALEQFINPLIKDEEPLEQNLHEKYDSVFGELDQARIDDIANNMQVETEALQRLCFNMQSYSHYKKIRYYDLGIIAWLMRYVLKTSAPQQSTTPLMFFDFTGEKDGSIRSQSKACYARLRETVRRSYLELAAAGRFDPNPIDEGVFVTANRPDEPNFRFLEEHFGDVMLRLGYAQPRANSVKQKHFELQPDTLRILMLSVLDQDAGNTNTLNEVCSSLGKTWGIVIGGLNDDIQTLREQNYFGFDEKALEHNTDAFAKKLKNLNLAFEPSDGLVLCSRDLGELL